MGMSAFPSFMTQATPATQPLINAEPAVAAQTEQNPQVGQVMPGGSVDNCITFQPVQNHVVIGDDSTIDFSKYYHFIPMPDLRAFANAGFPFSRKPSP